MPSADTPLKAVMFDLDGTLVDTMPHFADLAAQLIQSHYGTPRAQARERYLQTSGIPFRHQLEEIFPQDARNEPVAEKYEQRKRSICQAAQMTTQTLSALQKLRSRGLHLVLSSNSAQHYVDAFAAASPFRFDLALGFGGGLAKGTPHIERVCKAFEIAREQLLFVGDSLKDGTIAQENGVPFVARTGTFSKKQFVAQFPHTKVVDDIRQLPKLLEQIEGASCRS